MRQGVPRRPLVSAPLLNRVLISATSGFAAEDFDPRVFLRCVALGDCWRNGWLSCASKPPDRGFAVVNASLWFLLRRANPAAECAKTQHFDVFPAIRLMQGARISRTQSQCKRPSPCEAARCGSDALVSCTTLARSSQAQGREEALCLFRILMRLRPLHLLARQRISGFILGAERLCR